MATVTGYTFKESTVTKIATNVTTGTIHKNRLYGRGMTYIFTCRTTGADAPTLAQMKDEGYIGFQDHPEEEPISATSAVDVYVYCDNGNNIAGEYGKLVVII